MSEEKKNLVEPGDRFLMMVFKPSGNIALHHSKEGITIPELLYASRYFDNLAGGAMNMSAEDINPRKAKETASQ